MASKDAGAPSSKRTVGSGRSGGGGARARKPKGGPGYVDIFDESGNLLKQLIKLGPLDAPWGMAMAPQGFGSFGSTDGDEAAVQLYETVGAAPSETQETEAIEAVRIGN